MAQGRDNGLRLAFNVPEPRTDKVRMPDLRIFPLDDHGIDLVFPLVRSAADITPQRWRCFARELLSGEGGLLAVEAGTGCLHGLAVYRRRGTLRHGQALQVELLVAYELSRQAPVRKALCAALEALARNSGCRSIVYTRRAGSRDDADRLSKGEWRSFGARIATVDFVRSLKVENGSAARRTAGPRDALARRGFPRPASEVKA